MQAKTQEREKTLFLSRLSDKHYAQVTFVRKRTRTINVEAMLVTHSLSLRSVDTIEKYFSRSFIFLHVPTARCYNVWGWKCSSNMVGYRRGRQRWFPDKSMNRRNSNQAEEKIQTRIKMVLLLQPFLDRIKTGIWEFFKCFFEDQPMYCSWWNFLDGLNSVKGDDFGFIIFPFAASGFV